jgi:hypothetical protein
MLYHTAVLLLFRPFLNMEPPKGRSKQTPRDLCLNAALDIIRLLELYRARFTLRTCTNLFSHLVLSAGTILVLEAGSANCEKRLVAAEGLQTCIKDLDGMGARWASANRAARSLRALMRKHRVKHDEKAALLAASSTTTAPSTGESAPLESSASPANSDGADSVAPEYRDALMANRAVFNPAITEPATTLDFLNFDPAFDLPTQFPWDLNFGPADPGSSAG